MSRIRSQSRSALRLTQSIVQRKLHTSSFTAQKATFDISLKHFRELYEPNPQNADRPLDSFARRHFGASPDDAKSMLATIGYSDLDEFVNHVVPPQILTKRTIDIDGPQKGYTESAMLQCLKEIASLNDYKKRNFIGKGYYGTILPPVIQRNLLESPEWYTSYTPYQPEISQGRLEALLNFQTVVSDLTGLPVANASLLDEGTAASEAMLLSYNAFRGKRKKYVIDQRLHAQTRAVIRTRAEPFDIEIIELDLANPTNHEILLEPTIAGAMIQYPATDGSIIDLDVANQISRKIHSHGSYLSVATDLLALTLLRPPSTFDADIAFGSSQRLGVPMGFGGPHAAFFAVKDKLNRKIPGRIVGVSRDRLGKQALRLALQTREQHIKRDKATSNICTAQALLANVASMYCVYHGPKGLRDIAKRIYGFTTLLAQIVTAKSPHSIGNENWFDTLTIELSGCKASLLLDRARSQYSINLNEVNDNTISLSLDETTTIEDVECLAKLLTNDGDLRLEEQSLPNFPSSLLRTDNFLSNPVFNTYHCETEMMRYLHHLQSRDLSLANSMIPLGSCTMKLNSTVEMMPMTWPEFANIHPFQPADQVKGYEKLISSLEKSLCSITGLDAASFQPNSGAQGEYTGLKAIREYFVSIGQKHRNVCLIPISAHGTNPASAVMSGYKVIPVNCLDNGSLDLEDLKLKSEKHRNELAAIMITYPSTYGLFEAGIREAIDTVHKQGGQVYLDGANMNAQVGLTSPGDLGADVCHLNLHKTFAIPHGGGGPAGAPICVKSHLKPFLPGHESMTNFLDPITKSQIKPVSSSLYGNALVLPISYAYIELLGSQGLPYTSVLAMLNSNYLMVELAKHYKILFINEHNLHCAHEFIIDLRSYKKYGIDAIDVAKRLQDYGFHAPTMAFPVPGTLMVEPTESESKAELDKFIGAMISIKSEIDAFINGDSKGQVLKFAPHSLEDLITSKDWDSRGYTRELAAYPLPWLRTKKFFPVVSRVDDTYGDINLMCTCPRVEEFTALNDEIKS